MTPKIGAHVSSAGSLSVSFPNAEKIGAKCTQIFISPPQQWAQIVHSEEEVLKYQKLASESGIGPNFVHGAYLINLATANPVNLEKAVSWLAYALRESARLGLTGIIFHLGSAGERTFEQTLDQVTQAIKDSLDRSGNAINQPTFLILENCAGAGNLIGDNIDELAQIINRVGDNRVKVCLDTQHLFASGVDIREESVVENLLTEFEEKIGLEKLVAIHLNDSKTEFNSKKDRHENIGQGLIGLEPFRYLINHPKLINVPFILEVPGIEDDGPDKQNINLVTSLVK